MEENGVAEGNRSFPPYSFAKAREYNQKTSIRFAHIRFPPKFGQYGSV